ncbi:hypothetical protein CSB20_10305, partial [bacterium DOLZORAL124_64_63]
MAAGGSPDGLLRSAFSTPGSSEGLLEAVATLESALRAHPMENADPFLLSGLNGGAVAALLSAWRREHRRQALIVTPDRESAEQMAMDLETWLGRGEVVHLPQQEVLAFDRNSPQPALVGDFLDGLLRLRSDQAPLAVTSVYGLRQRVMAPGTLDRAVLRLKVGDRVDLDELGTRLVQRGYRPAGMVAKVGDFARRGGLFDIFTPGDEPLRVEFFDDEIISVRWFEVENQRTTVRGEEAQILPVSHMLLDDDAVLGVLGAVEQAMAAANETVDPDFLDDLEARLEDRLLDDGLESFLPWMGPSAMVMDYLPDGTALFWLEPTQLKAQSDLLDSELPRLRAGRLDNEPVLPAVEDLVLPGEKLRHPRFQHVFVAASWIAGDAEARWLQSVPSAALNYITTGQTLRGGNVQELKADLLRREAAGETVLLLCDNQGQQGRLAELLEESGDATAATVPLVAPLSAGFSWPQARLAVLTDHELFERYRRPGRTRKRSSGLVKERASLQPGEYVVHLEYGIGHYRGLRVISVEGVQRECLLLEYADGGKVYVPVENIDQVERYSSDQGANPPLARLGSGSWLKVKGKAARAIKAMAAELIELYAVREARPGYAFPADSPLQKALEDSFLFEETPDQLTAIRDSKRDMEESKPMDRLVCGDVGFGKTEVAIRAAFKAADAGKQVALLCPTTLLVHQHGDTFSERFRDFPVRVETLSRFKTPQEQKAILKSVAAGQ